jgi:lipopolysaccharide transport system ATP-binding protein
MSDVAKGGRTVVFVSHNMGSIQALCQKGIVLESGRVVHAGQIDDAVQMYLATLEDGSCTQLAQRFDDRSAPLAWYTDIYCQTPDGTRVTTALSGQSLDIVLAYRAQSDELYLDYAIAVYSSLGEKILHMATNFSHCEAVPSSRKGQVICSIPKLPLPEGTYSINASLRHGKDRLDWVRSAAVLQVQSGDYYGTGKIPPAGESKVLVDHKWTLGVRDSQS